MLLLFYSKMNKFSVDKFWVTFHGREFFSSSCLLPPAVSRSRRNKKKLERKKILQCEIKFFALSLCSAWEIIIICEDGSDFYFYFQGFFAPPELIDEKVFPYTFYHYKKGMENRKFHIYTHTSNCFVFFFLKMQVPMDQRRKQKGKVDQKVTYLLT